MFGLNFFMDHLLPDQFCNQVRLRLWFSNIPHFYREACLTDITNLEYEDHNKPNLRYEEITSLQTSDMKRSQAYNLRYEDHKPNLGHEGITSLLHYLYYPSPKYALGKFCSKVLRDTTNMKCTIEWSSSCPLCWLRHEQTC